ncbi:MAG: hypothetical protein JST82_11590 [Bacteroidetes bacterium]|nr:hypothetical protein [Bacteroidota bacterium]
MTYKRKTWAEKMKPGMKPHVEKVDKDFADIPAGASMLIATPEIVDAYIRHIPKGSHTSLQQMRKDLAIEYNAEYTCPVTSGIFLRIVAEHAYEEYQKGKSLSNITPFWRILDRKSPSFKKLTFGTAFVEEQWEKEKIV